MKEGVLGNVLKRGDVVGLVESRGGGVVSYGV